MEYSCARILELDDLKLGQVIVAIAPVKDNIGTVHPKGTRFVVDVLDNHSPLKGPLLRREGAPDSDGVWFYWYPNTTNTPACAGKFVEA